MNELVNGVFLPEARESLLAIAERMKTREGMEGLILGGTELPPRITMLHSMSVIGEPFTDASP
jgi:aspartate/glutamate racemase